MSVPHRGTSFTFTSTHTYWDPMCSITMKDTVVHNTRTLLVPLGKVKMLPMGANKKGPETYIRDLVLSNSVKSSYNDGGGRKSSTALCNYFHGK